MAILALQHKICIKSQGLRSSHNLGKITVTAVKYASWKNTKDIFCLDLMQGGKKGVRSFPHVKSSDLVNPLCATLFELRVV